LNFFRLRRMTAGDNRQRLTGRDLSGSWAVHDDGKQVASAGSVVGLPADAWIVLRRRFSFLPAMPFSIPSFTVPVMRAAFPHRRCLFTLRMSYSSAGGRRRVLAMDGSFRSGFHGLRTGLLASHPGLITLNAPCLTFFPVPVPFPVSPVLLDLVVVYAFVIPWAPFPAVCPVIVPPAGRHPPVKRRNVAVEDPSRVVAARAVPAPLPGTPPPAVKEKDVRRGAGDGIDISTGQDDKCRRCGEGQRRRKPDIDVYIDVGLRESLSPTDQDERRKQCSE